MNRRKVKELRRLGLGVGESEAIALAEEIKAGFVITDDQRAGQIVHSRKLEVVKSVEILLLAKAMGLIPSLKPVMDKMRRQKFWIDDETYESALKRAKEL